VVDRAALRDHGDLVEVVAVRPEIHARLAMVEHEMTSLVPTILICPTSASTPPASFHPEIVVSGEQTRVMCEMVGPADSRALGERVGRLTLDEAHAVDDALELVLGLA
jgi:mRNA-degrading endonuclease toxin of MazEF toxin-antitoxin module